MSASTTDETGPDQTPAYRLPTSVRPHAYRLVLRPDLAAATFSGDVEIDLTVERPPPRSPSTPPSSTSPSSS